MNDARPEPADSWTAVAVATAVRDGRLRAEAVLAAHVDLHRATHDRLNALVQPRHVAAYADARTIDSRSAGPPGPLQGVPVSVKDCFAVRGLATTLGLRSRAASVDAADAPLVGSLVAAGAVIVGKSNVPQALYLHETDNPLWGRTRHPATPDRGPGGSSGGDAALVAAGVVPLALGNDLAGSLRQPAHACGIAAIMPRSCVLGDGGGFDTQPHVQAVRPRAGFLARTVGDLELALEAVAADRRAAGPPSGLRIGWWDQSGPVPSSSAVVRGVREALDRLRSAGCMIARLDAALADEAAWLHLAILAADGGADIRRLLGAERPMRGVARLVGLAALPRWLRGALAPVLTIAGRDIEAGGLRATGPLSPAEVAELVARRDALAVRFAAATAGCDCIVSPVSALPALRHGTAARLVFAAAPCFVANLLGLPAGAVPVTTVRSSEQSGRPPSRDPVLRAAASTDAGSVGLPVGVQVIGCPGRTEGDVLRVMRWIEAAGGATPAAT